ncbi:hypothetical protein Gorai_003885 [Gossypium raimondii]|uniref:MLO-like protein n=1 Tax=Gossypium raimondii TaxID=29730 RepID=A0A7J8QGK7_GOSRA|nr:hypothetical protein [Gossypium raimondii]
MADATYKTRSLEETPTWAVAVVCLALVVISIIIELAIHMLGKWFKKRHKTALYEALEKVKAELMLMGFISLLLTVTQSLISDICIPRSIANTWHPCDQQAEAQKYGQISGRKLVEFSDDDDDDDTSYIPRRTQLFGSLLSSSYLPIHMIVLMVGTKLQVIITELAVSIQDRGGVVKGAPLVRPGDDLFCIRSCYHEHLEDIIIRISMGVITQFICSYVTLPLYALVTQMGSNMRPTIFNERVATALRNWHQKAKKHTKQNKQSHSQNTTPLSSRPATPTHEMSPVHLLHNYPRSVESYPPSPRLSITENNRLVLHSPRQHGIKDDVDDRSLHKKIAQADATVEESNSLQRVAMAQTTRTQHEIDIASSVFSLQKK